MDGCGASVDTLAGRSEGALGRALVGMDMGVTDGNPLCTSIGAGGATRSTMVPGTLVGMNTWGLGGGGRSWDGAPVGMSTGTNEGTRANTLGSAGRATVGTTGHGASSGTAIRDWDGTSDEHDALGDGTSDDTVMGDSEGGVQ
jgi:hypothetical protein